MAGNVRLFFPLRNHSKSKQCCLYEISHKHSCYWMLMVSRKLLFETPILLVLYSPVIKRNLFPHDLASFVYICLYTVAVNRVSVRHGLPSWCMMTPTRNGSQQEGLQDSAEFTSITTRATMPSGWWVAKFRTTR